MFYNIVLAIVFLWAFYTFCREQGWVLKKDVRGKHIFITGAGGGLGRGMAFQFAKLGANLTLVDKNEDTLKETIVGIIR